MMVRVLFFMSLLLVLVASAGCSPKQESGLQGQVLFDGQPLRGAEIEIYLKSEKDRATQPFAVSSSDASGNFQVMLPAGRYYVIGKKRETGSDGRIRMLMAECPANPLEVSSLLRVPSFSLREMGRDGKLVADPGTGIHGRLLAAGQPVGQAFVYVYLDPTAGLMGPSYGEAVQTEADGRFQVDLPAGRYYLAARQRADGSRLGEPRPGDLNGIYAGNPVELSLGETRQLPDWSLLPVNAVQQQQRLQKGKFARTATALTGSVVDDDGSPVAGVYVFAYLDSRMVGKPTYLSDPSDSGGGFRLNLGSGGAYYVGARSAFGGPLEPGEWVGTYAGQADHRFEVTDGKVQALGNIVVREVW